MSTIELEVKTKITLELTVGEAGALSAICGYGPEIFLRWFQETHGMHYIEPYKTHLRTLFNKARYLHHEVDKVEAQLKELPKLIIL